MFCWQRILVISTCHNFSITAWSVNCYYTFGADHISIICIFISSQTSSILVLCHQRCLTCWRKTSIISSLAVWHSEWSLCLCCQRSLLLERHWTGLGNECFYPWLASACYEWVYGDLWLLAPFGKHNVSMVVCYWRMSQ